MNKPRIIIEGPAGSGKSTLVWIIARALNAHDVGVHITGEGEEVPREITATIEGRLTALRDKGPIEVHSHQLRRPSQPKKGMTLAEIKEAIGAGKVVCWSNPGYRVTGKNPENLMVTFTPNGHSIGLTNVRGEMTHKEEDFFIHEEAAPA